MKKHYLHKLFEPRSVAVIGASDRLDAVGGRVLHNIIEGGFEGELYPQYAYLDRVADDAAEVVHPDVVADFGTIDPMYA